MKVDLIMCSSPPFCCYTRKYGVLVGARSGACKVKHCKLGNNVERRAQRLMSENTKRFTVIRGNKGRVVQLEREEELPAQLEIRERDEDPKEELAMRLCGHPKSWVTYDHKERKIYIGMYHRDRELLEALKATYEEDPDFPGRWVLRKQELIPAGPVPAEELEIWEEEPFWELVAEGDTRALVEYLLKLPLDPESDAAAVVAEAAFDLGVKYYKSPYDVLTKKVYVIRLDKSIPLPRYATDGSVAFDLCAACDMEILPGTSAHVPTGLVIDTNDIPGAHVEVLPRSSLFKKKGLLIANSVGTIDKDYCGATDEIFLFVFAPLTREHLLHPEKLNEPIRIYKGERLAQARLTCYVKAHVVELEEPRQKEARGGCGSTGGYK